MQANMPMGNAQVMDKRPTKRSGQSASRQGAASGGAGANSMNNSNQHGTQFNLDTKQKIY